MMRALKLWLVCVFIFSGPIGAAAEPPPLDCSKKSLAEAVAKVSSENSAITFTGVCSGPIVIAIDGLTLRGVGSSIIDGGGGDAVTVTGASRVSLIDFDVTNGRHGIVVNNGAHVSLTGLHSHDNLASGIVIQTASSARVSDLSASNNGGTGLVGDDGVSIVLVSSTITGNTVKDIQLTFASRADFQTLLYGTYTCDATVLVRGTSGILCPH